MHKKKQNPRIIAGIYKNQRLQVPESARPMTDRIKQSVFDSLSEWFAGAKVLDLYAGAGNIGLEALSRGAESCTFVEMNPEATQCIDANIAKLSAENTTVIQSEVTKFMLNASREDNKFDLIFADPPFPHVANFQLKLVKKILNPDGLLVLRTPIDHHVKVHNSLELAHSQEYGESRVYYMKPKLSL